MSAQGIQVYHVPLETPEAIGRVERHGGVPKGMARKVIAQTQARGEVEIQSALDESCLTMNSLLRNGGYSPSHWVLGRAPTESAACTTQKCQVNPSNVLGTGRYLLRHGRLHHAS